MIIGITGSWRARDQVRWGLRSDFASFRAACFDLGVAIAKTGATIAVGSESPSTADMYVVEGYLSHPSAGLKVRVVRPDDGTFPFLALHTKHPDAFIPVPASTTAWRHTRQRFVAEVDTLITVGGGDGTYQVGLELGLTRKKLVPIGSFGGASSLLLKERLLPGTLRMSERYQKLASSWIPGMENHVVEVVGANLPPKVLIIHGHAPDRLELQKWLQDEKLAGGIVLGEQVSAGLTLPEKFEQEASETDAAIALATPDDLCSPVSDTNARRLRARQNVWVEVGWFWGRLGRNRVLILARDDIEVPSDLNSILYEKYHSSPKEAAPKIRAFLADVGRRSQ